MRISSSHYCCHYTLFLGKKAQKKQNEQQAQIEANKRPITMLVLKKIEYE